VRFPLASVQICAIVWLLKRSKQMRNPMKHANQAQDPKYANRVWQSAYFNADRAMPEAQRMQEADRAYQAHVQAQAVAAKQQ
jgi:hypothetical protein